MMPTVVNEQAPIASPSYQRAQARLGSALHIDALTLVTTLHLLTLCRLAVRLAHHRCPPPLPAGPGGAPQIYREESLLLIALLRTLWRLSYADMRDWLYTWPALALACGLPLGRDRRPRIRSRFPTVEARPYSRRSLVGGAFRTERPHSSPSSADRCKRSHYR